MATSSSYDYTLTAAQLIKETLQLLHVVDGAGTVDSNDEATCLVSLNLMLKTLQAEGVGLWKNVEGSLFPEYEKYSFDIGPSSSNYVSSAGYKTEIATAASSGASSIVVDSATNISDADVIGVELDDGTVQWTTVNGSPSGTTVTLTASLTDDVAEDNHVYNYTSLIQRPLEIVEARRVNSDGSENPIDIISRQEYMSLSNKDQAGTPIQIYYDPLLTNGKMWVYQAFSDVKEYIKFTARIPIEDIDATANNFDLPQEWLLPLAWNLAVLVAPKFRIELSPLFVARAEDLKNTVRGFDMEDTSVYFRAKCR